MSVVRDVASVTVSEPVDGTRHRRARAAEQARRAPVTVARVHPLVMAAARRVQRPGERVVVVDERTVRLVSDG
jgi:hypothetical protein